MPRHLPAKTFAQFRLTQPRLQTASKLAGAPSTGTRSPSSRWKWLLRHRRGWLYPYTGLSTGQPTSQISWAQACLAQIVGPWVPQDGLLGPVTRSAIQTFQTQQQLPATGALDLSTVNALQAACSGAQQAPPPAAIAAPPPQAMAPPAAVASPEAAPPGAPPPPDAGPPPGEAELSFARALPTRAGLSLADAVRVAAANAPKSGRVPAAAHEPDAGAPAGEEKFEHDLVADAPFAVELQSHARIPVQDESQFAAAPAAPGIYVIFEGTAPWYVGIAEKDLKERLTHMVKDLRRLHVPVGAVNNRSVSWTGIVSAKAQKGGLKVIQKGGMARTTGDGVHAILMMLQHVLIRKYGTQHRGNGHGGVLRFSGAGQLVIRENGRQAAIFQSGQTVDNRAPADKRHS